MNRMMEYRPCSLLITLIADVFCLRAWTVGTLLSMCSSSCLPGGGSNTELALHCLHYCQGNTMVILTAFLFFLLHQFFYLALHRFIIPPPVTTYFHASLFTYSFPFGISFPVNSPCHCMLHLYVLYPTIPLSCAGHAGDAAVLTALTDRRLPLLW